MTRPKEELKFPRRGQAGSGELIWERLRLSAALDTLHNPRYAGAFCFGKTRSWKDPQGGRHCVDLPREQWAILIKEAHPGYISWEEFEENQKRLQLNQQTRGLGRHSGPAREGPALLQGLVICGKCGRSMTLRYHKRDGRLSPDYLCQQQRIEHYLLTCQSIPGAVVDDALSTLIQESLSPLALEVALSVQQELQERLAESDRLRRQYVERAQYEAEQARVRICRGDPRNALWPIHSRHSGTTSSGNWSKHVRITKSNGKAANGQSPGSRRRRSWL